MGHQKSVRAGRFALGDVWPRFARFGPRLGPEHLEAAREGPRRKGEERWQPSWPLVADGRRGSAGKVALSRLGLGVCGLRCVLVVASKLSPSLARSMGRRLVPSKKMIELAKATNPDSFPWPSGKSGQSRFPGAARRLPAGRQGNACHTRSTNKI